MFDMAEEETIARAIELGREITELIKNKSLKRGYALGVIVIALELTRMNMDGLLAKAELLKTIGGD